MFPYDRDISRLFHILRRAGGVLPAPGIRHPALKVSITARGIPSPAELSLTYTSLILIITVAVAACCAAVLFIPLRRAPVRRRLLTYFISMPVFVFLSVFFFSDIGTALAALGVGAAGLSAEFFGYTGLTAVCGAGIVYLGFCALLCSHGAMKKKGRTAILVTSLVYFALEYLLWVAALFAGKVERYTLGEVFPAVGKVSFLAPAAESGLFAFSILLLVLYITGYLLSFTAVMKDGETESPAARGGKSRAKSGDAAVAKRRAAEPEDYPDSGKCCLTCVFSRKLSVPGGKVLCDRKGVTDAGFCCGRYEYDPLKTEPLRPPLPTSGPENDGVAANDHTQPTEL